ncbi:MAG: hypothetical protein LBC72_04170 [Spirochaetaceae bacterium]|jgi:hypothetical protein|nr:hypothetical protein [Spirochaetaceae bacterium]
MNARKTVFTTLTGGVILALLAACEVPGGVQLQSKDWNLHVPVGSTKFEQADDGFSLNKLQAAEIQNMLGDGFEGIVYDGYEQLDSSGRRSAQAAERRLQVRAGSAVIDAKDQQTYLIHYPVPLGQKEIKQEMKDSFNKALDDSIALVMEQLRESVPEYARDDAGYLEQPPTEQELLIPVAVNTTLDSDSPRVKTINNLVFDVRLTFKNELPRSGGRSITSMSAAEAKSVFGNWVKFKCNGETNYGPAAAVVYDPAEPRLVIWRSPKASLGMDGDEAGDNANLISIVLNLEPKLVPPSLANGFTIRRGIVYNPDLEVHDFESITLVFPEGKGSAEHPQNMGDTSAFASLITMLGGAEFERAYMYTFSEVAINNGIQVVARPRGENPRNRPEYAILSGALTQAPFRTPVFYPTGAAATITASSTPFDLSTTLLAKNAPAYDLLYWLEPNITFTISNSTGVDIALVVPLSFVVRADEETKEVRVENDDAKYMKLNVEQLDNMLGDNGQNDFDLKEKTSDFGTLKKVNVTLAIANKILPKDLQVGLTGGTERGGYPLYENAVKLENGKRQTLQLNDANGGLKIPQPALLVKAGADGKAVFKIDRVTPEKAESDISVQIVADILVDFDYKMKL